MIVCRYCGGPHPWWDCRKKPEGWKPAAKAPEEEPAVLEPDGTLTTLSAYNAKRSRGRPPSDNPKSPRAEYQREYMRQRRAKQKEKKDE